MNCIFICVFTQLKYVEMLFLLLKSIILFGNLDDNTEILIYTSTQFRDIIESKLENNSKIKFEVNDNYHNIDKACKARLDLFNLESVKRYDKILYLDTDIIIKDSINKVFEVCKDDILYVLEEGSIDHPKCGEFWGKSLFGKEINYYEDKSAFTSGILLFKNSKKMKDLFDIIIQDIKKRNHSFYDQPHIVYNAFKFNLFNNKILKSYACTNVTDIHVDKVIFHFPGAPGVYIKKIPKMREFLKECSEYILSKNK